MSDEMIIGAGIITIIGVGILGIVATALLVWLNND